MYAPFVPLGDTRLYMGVGRLRVVSKELSGYERALGTVVESTILRQANRTTT